MIAYKQCMKVGVVLNPPLHWINNYKKDKECGVIGEKIVWWILENLVAGVVGEAERGLMN
jgi:hypothetical protein